MSKDFWNKEYSDPTHLKLSTEPSGDMVSFVRWAERNSEWPPFPKGGFVLDLGCGNGRNIINLCSEAGMEGLGIDISEVAISQAKKQSKSLGLNINFKVGSIAEKFELPDESVDVVLDLMTSHFLNKKERENLVKEIVRMIKPYGWMLFKTFLLDGDAHAKRLLKESPSDEEGTYKHPRIGVSEHVFNEEEIFELFSPYFKIYKTLKSYKHVTKDGKPHKRRTISVYMERKRE